MPVYKRFRLRRPKPPTLPLAAAQTNSKRSHIHRSLPRSPLLVLGIRRIEVVAFDACAQLHFDFGSPWMIRPHGKNICCPHYALIMQIVCTHLTLREHFWEHGPELRVPGFVATPILCAFAEFDE